MAGEAGEPSATQVRALADLVSAWLGDDEDATAPNAESLTALVGLMECGVLESWIGPGPLSAPSLLDLTSAFARVGAWAARGMRAAAHSLYQHEGHDSTTRWCPDRVHVSGTTTEEIATRLGVSQQHAGRLIAEGQLYGGVLYPVGAAMTTGVIDAGKGSIFADHLLEQPPEIAQAVCEAVLPDAPYVTHHALRERVERAVVAVDPRTAAERHRATRTRRSLSGPRARAHGMASMTFYAPMSDAAALDTVCESAARAARAAGDERTLAQLRADALTTMAIDALTHGHVIHTACNAASSCAPPVRVAVAVSAEVATATTTEGVVAATEAAIAASAGPPPVVPIAVPTEAVAATTTRPATAVPTEAPTEAVAATTTRPATAVPTEAPTEAAAAVPSEPTAGAPMVVVATASTNPTTLAAAPLPAFTPQRRPPDDGMLPSGEAALSRAFRRKGRLVLEVTESQLDAATDLAPNPADLLAWDIDACIAEAVGADPPGPEHPGHPDHHPDGAASCRGYGRARGSVPRLRGHGALAPGTARELVSAAPPWLDVQIVPEPPPTATAGASDSWPGVTASGDGGWDIGPEDTVPDDTVPDDTVPDDTVPDDTVPAYVVPGYDIPTWLARLVRADHPTCVAPMCSVSSDRCDLDHVVPHPVGPTSRANLRPLCRRHHVLKTHAGFRLSVRTDGSTVWTTPLGQRIRRASDGATARLPNDPAGAARLLEGGAPQTSSAA